MALALRKVWSRLSHMSWDEVHTRVRQEVDKRLDFAIHRAGFPPRMGRLRTSIGKQGRFFFSAEELAERTSLLQRYLPLDVRAIVDEADEICDHRFRLLGYTGLDFGTGDGNEIDWHLDSVHGKRTPLLPWYKINFLDFNVAGDHKIIWELNRHQHLVVLAKAWRLTRQDRYVEEAIGQWHSWQRANPYPLGVNWASSLEVAFRSLSWLWLEHLLVDCPILTTNFSNHLQSAFALNGHHIERYLSTYFSPNTHLLGEAVALFFLGTLCPQLSTAKRWKQLGSRIIEEEAHKQVRPDGVYFEQSVYYHVYALDFFLHARLLAARNGMEAPPCFDEVILKMLAVVQALTQVGPPDGFGDDDGGRLFNPRRNRAEHMADPLAVGAAFFPDKELQFKGTCTEEAIWLFGCDALRYEGSPNNAGSQPKSQCFPDGGLYILASDHSLPQQMVIDAGPQGTARSGHGHADALSAKLSLGNRQWLVDSGTFAYVTDGGERRAFRGTRQHNTLTVDGLDQAVPEGSFAWSSLPTTQVEWWIPGATFAFFAASHSGYERLAEPVRHRRCVFHLSGGFWLVRDVVEGKGTHLLESSWHFASDLEVSSGENGFVASPSTGSRPSSGGVKFLRLLPIPDPRWKCDMLSEYVSPAYGRKVPAPVLRCSARAAAPIDHAMLLIPSSGGNETAGKFSSAAAHNGSASSPAVYAYEVSETLHHMVFGPATEPWTFGPWKSDCRFLYFCVENRKVTHLVCCQGRFVSLYGRQLFSRDAPLQYLEWWNRKAEARAFSSDAAVARSLSEAAFEVINPGTRWRAPEA